MKSRLIFFARNTNLKYHIKNRRVKQTIFCCRKKCKFPNMVNSYCRYIRTDIDCFVADENARNGVPIYGYLPFKPDCHVLLNLPIIISFAKPLIWWRQYWYFHYISGIINITYKKEKAYGYQRNARTFT